MDPTGHSFAPTGCNLGGVLCPGGVPAEAPLGGASAGALWAVEAVFGIRWRLVVDFLVDSTTASPSTTTGAPSSTSRSTGAESE